MLAEAQRHAALARMGIDVYLLRARAATPCSDDAPAQHVELVVACASDVSGSAAAQQLRGLLPLALGIAAPRIHWIVADIRGELPAPPQVSAYLALGAQMPRALGANLSTLQQNSATIAAADAPAASLRDGASKRALWQALKPVARRLRGAA